MNNTFSLQQMSQTGNLDSNLLLRHYKLDLMARFKGRKSMNPNSKQSEVAKEIVCSRIPYNDIDKIKNCFYFIEFHQTLTKKDKRIQIVDMISKDFKWPNLTSKNLN